MGSYRRIRPIKYVEKRACGATMLRPRRQARLGVWSIVWRRAPRSPDAVDIFYPGASSFCLRRLLVILCNAYINSFLSGRTAAGPREPIGYEPVCLVL